MTKRKHRRRENYDRQPDANPAKERSPRPSEDRGGGTYYIYGAHPVRAALLNPDRTCLELIGTRDALDGLAAALGERKIAERVPKTEVAERRAIDRRVGDEAVHQGLALRVRPLPRKSLDDVLARADGPDGDATLLVAFDQVTDPRNVGAILRTASLFGAAAAILTDRNAPEENGALAKAAAGALDILPVVRVPNLARALDDAKAGGFWVLGLDGGAEAALGPDLPGPRRLLVLGAEGAGLRRLTREHCDLLVRIPMAGKGRAEPAATALESFNVSTAAAIALYELTRSGGQ